MGIMAALRLNKTLPSTRPNGQASAPGIRSPWTTTQMQQVVFADIFGTDTMPVTRAEAMSIPSVVKARLLITALASSPLRAYKGDTLVDPQPTFLYRTNSQVPPATRMLWTCDDLLFTGWSLWAVERGTRGAILDAIRVPPELWHFDSNQRVIVNNEPVKAEDVILFSGPYEGLLEAGARTIRAARDLETAVAQRVRNPIPLVELSQTLDETIEDSEIDDLLDGYVKARRDPDGAVLFSPYGVELNVHGDVKTDLFVDARNAIRLDIANFTGIPASLLDGSMSTASLTYTTQEGRRSDFLDLARPVWLSPIEARLSMDDVVPAGQRCAFDLSEYSVIPPTGTGPSLAD